VSDSSAVCIRFCMRSMVMQRSAEVYERCYLLESEPTSLLLRSVIAAKTELDNRRCLHLHSKPQPSCNTCSELVACCTHAMAHRLYSKMMSQLDHAAVRCCYSLQVQGCALLQQGVPGGSMATAQAHVQGTAAPAAPAAVAIAAIAIESKGYRALCCASGCDDCVSPCASGSACTALLASSSNGTSCFANVRAYIHARRLGCTSMSLTLALRSSNM
jgi:hypothetical protein